MVELKMYGFMIAIIDSIFVSLFQCLNIIKVFKVYAYDTISLCCTFFTPTIY